MRISRDRNADVCFQFYVLTNTRNFFSKLTEEFGTDAAAQILSSEIIIGKYPVILYYNYDNRQNYLETYYDVNCCTGNSKTLYRIFFLFLKKYICF